MKLTYRDRGQSKSGTIWDVMSGSLAIAKIWKAMSSNERYQTWAWTFHVSCKPEGFQIHGSGASLDEAKAHVERHWQAWLEAAELSSKDYDEKGPRLST
jgi:hypothetical protein